MNYPVFELLVSSSKLKTATPSDVEAVDDFIFNVSEAQAQRLHPWRVSARTKVYESSVREILTHAVQSGLLSIMYEVWCPNTSINILDATNSPTIGQTVECQRCNCESHAVAEDDIHIYYRKGPTK
jgi:hypothetical protein